MRKYIPLGSLRSWKFRAVTIYLACKASQVTTSSETCYNFPNKSRSKKYFRRGHPGLYDIDYRGERVVENMSPCWCDCVPCAPPQVGLACSIISGSSNEDMERELDGICSMLRCNHTGVFLLIYLNLTEDLLLDPFRPSELPLYRFNMVVFSRWNCGTWWIFHVPQEVFFHIVADTSLFLASIHFVCLNQ